MHVPPSRLNVNRAELIVPRHGDCSVELISVGEHGPLLRLIVFDIQREPRHIVITASIRVVEAILINAVSGVEVERHFTARLVGIAPIPQPIRHLLGVVRSRVEWDIVVGIGWCYGVVGCDLLQYGVGVRGTKGGDGHVKAGPDVSF